ncbi:gamma-glutamyltransferase [uncultured Winogradskyella sp.]|uniref:gamma-glutamyltransferase n=1 Tax=uncultured Winogradskyella sp. TaxID=395353 RepID=UPI00351687D5
MRRVLFCITLTLLFYGCRGPETTETARAKNEGLITTKAMVVSARQEASDIGVDLMKKGGNAFDAMLATSMALAVTYPYAGNLGGGGFIVYRLEDGTKGALDFREKAPLAASKDMYLNANGDIIPNKSTLGSYAIAVPGTVAGIFKAHERFGRLDVETVLRPVVDLAKRGFRVTKLQAESLNKYDSIFKQVNKKDILFSKAYKPGDTIKNIALANTLERLIQYGSEDFYKGETAKKLVAFLQTHGALITVEDLEAYQAKWRDPISFTYDDLTITSMSPPSSGGIVLQQIMGMIEDFDLKATGHNTLETIQVLVEAEKRAYADRAFYLGDPDFVDIPSKQLTSKAYLKERMANFTLDHPTPSEDISHGHIETYESDETTHFSIVDQFGNALAMTTTLNGAYGSKLYADELGFFLNNEMDDFSSKPGEPNIYGLIGAEANSIQPEKRMLSSMTPTIIEKQSKLFMVLGTPGGSTIITSVLQTILNVHEFGLCMQEAVDAPRFHHQWLPDEIRMEPEGFDPIIIEQLIAKGYPINFERTPIIGKVDAILIRDDGTLEGGADHRGDDAASGF